ncbi:MAG: SIS domain-containing protein, partial [Acidimicrobiales bacterium]
VLTVAGGGPLARAAEAAGSPLVPVLTAVPQARAALGALVVSPLVLLERLGLLPGAAARVADTVEVVARRRDQLVRPGSVADDVARRIGRTFPLVHGAAGAVAVAARRWKAQVNQNAKAPAFWSAQPELCHDELAGWGQHGDVTRQLLTVVALRHRGEQPEVARRATAVGELLAEVVAGVVEVWTEAPDDCARLFDLALVGDVVSLHLAAREGIDPGPVPVAAELGARLQRP